MVKISVKKFISSLNLYPEYIKNDLKIYKEGGCIYIYSKTILSSILFHELVDKHYLFYVSADYSGNSYICVHDRISNLY